MADLPADLRTIVSRYGAHVLDDWDGLRSTLNDYLDEDSSPGDVNLLVDAVRFGSLDRLRTLLGQGAEPSAALTDAAEGLADRRGGDAESAYWACAVLGYAVDLLPAEQIPGPRKRPASLLPPTATGPSPENLDVTRVVGQAEPASPGPIHGAAHQTTPTGSRSPARLAVAIVVVVALAAGGIWLLLRDTTSSPTADGTDASTGMLLDFAQQGNEAEAPKTPFPDCKPAGRGHVTCSAPAPEVGPINLYAYGNLADLYAAYKQRVQDAGGTFDSGNCRQGHTKGEISWNHLHHHLSQYTFPGVEAGTTKLSEAEGRIFCTIDHGGRFLLVWTDSGTRVLGVVSGGNGATYAWWKSYHHHLGRAM
jgi:hypothetical protein